MKFSIVLKNVHVSLQSAGIQSIFASQDKLYIKAFLEETGPRTCNEREEVEVQNCKELPVHVFFEGVSKEFLTNNKENIEIWLEDNKVDAKFFALSDPQEVIEECPADDDMLCLLSPDHKISTFIEKEAVDEVGTSEQNCNNLQQTTEEIQEELQQDILLKQVQEEIKNNIITIPQDENKADKEHFSHGEVYQNLNQIEAQEMPPASEMNIQQSVEVKIDEAEAPLNDQKDHSFFSPMMQHLEKMEKMEKEDKGSKWEEDFNVKKFVSDHIKIPALTRQNLFFGAAVSLAVGALLITKVAGEKVMKP